MNLFATVLTYCQPSANYRGESELNRSVIQKVTDGRFDYPIISPESMRNALREILAGYGLPCNRERLHPVSGGGKGSDGSDKEDKQQLAVRFKKYPDPKEYVDDFFFGYLLAVKGKELQKLREAKGANYPLKRDSVLRMNLAKALEPYRHNAVFTQSPQLADGNPWKPGGGETAASSALLHRETAVTAFQFPFALNLNDCNAKTDWTKKLLQAIGELSDVAGNHARSYYEMAPASIIVRLTDSLVAGYNTYGFQTSGQAPNDIHTFPEVIDGILHNPPDYPGNEFYLGGKLVKDMDQKTQKDLGTQNVKLEREPRRLLELVANKALGG